MRTLPIHDVLDGVRGSLAANANLVLVAPPGAGKTTVVPLAIRDEPWCTGRIIMLEPRRIAARAAASRMASTLGERVGETVGLRVRLDTKVSRATRVEVVTEGVFTRAILSDPSLDGVSAVVLDEFHERSLDADLALALTLDAQASLRPDLRIIVMSATLDGARVADLMGASVVESDGRAFPVEIEHDERRPDERVETKMAAVVRRVLAERNGSVLCFLPGVREIRAVERVLQVPEDVRVLPLYGALSPQRQDEAIRPVPHGRKVVLATAIAETSVTIDGVTQVVDSGLSRRPRFDVATGLTRLETVRASRASVDQRAGRAGRTAPGHVVRLWRREQTVGLERFDPPEMLAADLSALALDLADWGVRDVKALKWLDEPPAPAINEARALLRRLGCLDADNGPTAHGRKVAQVPLPPRLAHMVLTSANPLAAAQLALLTQERGLGGDDVDVAARLARFERDGAERSKAIKGLARRIADGRSKTGEESVGAALSRAFPDRIAMRGGPAPDGMQRFRMANGAGVEIAAEHRLAREDWLVVVDCAGAAGRARLLSGAAIGRDEIEALHGAAFERVTETALVNGRVRGIERMRLGTLVMEERTVEPDDAAALGCLLDAMQGRWLKGMEPLLARLRVLDGKLFAADALDASLAEWLAPFVPGARAFGDVAPERVRDALLARAGLDAGSLERALPTRWTAPTGRGVEIDYASGQPAVSLRPQEAFGLDNHPLVAGRPLVFVFVSPAGRPIQTTADLPAFWRSSWRDVRADLRGRYPKHPWPEKPWTEAPTSRVKHPKG